MNAAQLERRRRFRDMHQEEGCFIIPNAWDIGSARMLEAAGFTALATTSAGIAFSLGRVDHGYAPAHARVDRDTMLERVAGMAAALSVPLSADLEAGYGSAPEAVAETIRRALDAGAAGGNIEDFSGDERAPLFDLELARDRIRAAREVIDRHGAPFVLVGRTDGFLVGADALAESIRRGNALREAGADCIFVPGVSDAKVIERLVREIDAPLNVVMGLTGSPLTFAELKAIGVRRITIGGSLARAMYYHLRQAASEMMERGTFSFGDHQVPHGELNRIFEAP
jgi:2-methylisocitrate lyase-like PEP mutase family enzyme